MTAAQRRALEFLAQHGKVAPRHLALLMWPDSKAWNKVTRKYGGHTGAVGGTMPMKAATLLWRLQSMGYAS